MKTYTYSISGVGSNGQVWQTEGIVECEFIAVFDTVMRDSFLKLTEGKAVYGKPGVGCEGPYEVYSIIISQIKH